MGTLFVVATPIGNLEDITLRALKVLGEVDFIACEDTRHSGILLNHYKIKKQLISFHQHSKLQKVDYIIDKIKKGENCALITDAGTPNISDPGGVLIEKAWQNNISVVSIPGVSAVASILSIANFPVNSFLFLGFLAKKKGRQTLLRNLMKAGSLELYEAVVLYESPYRIIRTLQDFQLAIGNKDVVIGRELTKKFEEIYRGKISDAITYYTQKEPKGEFAIIVRT